MYYTSRNSLIVATEPLTHLLTCLHDDCNPRDEICRLLSYLGRLVIESPQDGATDLRQVRLHPLPQSIHYGAKPIQHHYILEGEAKK